MRLSKWSVVVMMLCATASSAFAIAQLTWTYSGSLATPVPSVSAGWIVQLYKDVNSDTALSTITSFDASDLPVGGGASTSDDQRLATYQTTVNGSFAWTTYYANTQSMRIYSVLFNSSSLATASQAWIVDTTPTSITSGSTITYTANATPSTVYSGALSVVPEPSSLLLLAVGLSVIALRRRR